MSNSISWMGNRVVNPGAPLQTPAPGPSVVQTPQSVTVPPPSPVPRSSDLLTQQGPPPSTEKGYIPYYLASHIGKNVRAEFILGTSQFADRTGLLTEVGINYFVLRDVNSRTDIMCDLYSVKFVTVLLDS